MYNAPIPTDNALPSTAKLVKSTLFAAVTAGILLVTVVMPAEYGIDPTGVGTMTGLQKMGEIKRALAQEAAAERAPKGQATVAVAGPVVAPAPVAKTLPNHEMKVILAPNEGTEIKVVLEKGKSVKYTWWTDGGKANVDVHGDSQELAIDYYNYSKGSEQRQEGVIVAAFNGQHGWFWRNRTPNTITMTLQTVGEYTDIKHME